MAMRHGYKRTEAGLTPQDWDVVPIGELFSFKNGLNKAKTYFGYGTPIVNYMDVFNRPGLRIENIVGRVNVSSKELAAYEVRKGDVFFTRTSETVDEIGVASVMLDQPERTVFSGFVLRARPCDDSLDNTFKCYCFASRYFRQQVTSRASYTTRALTNGRTLSAALLARPPLAEQRTIAAALNDVDALLDGLDRLIAKKRDLKQAAMQQLLIGQKRLPGFDGKWEMMRLGNIVSFLKGSGLSKADLALDGKRRCVHYGELFTTYGECINEVLHGTYREESFVYSLCNDVLMPTSDVTPNGLATASCIRISNVILGGDILIIRPPDEILNGEFLAHSIRANRDQVLQFVSGTTVFHLYGRDMADFCLPAPSAKEQTAIVEVLSDMEAEIAALEARRDKTRDLKQAMMQDLLTGKTRLVEPEVAHA